MDDMESRADNRSAAPEPADVEPATPAVAAEWDATEPDTMAEAPVTASRHGWSRWLIGGAIAIVALAGALAGALILGARPLPEALRYLPADSVVVVELRPDLPGDQRQHLGNLLAHFPGFADQSTLGTKLDEVFERIVTAASGGSVDYASRVKPLLSGPIVAGVSADGISGMVGGNRTPTGLLVATTDGTATCDLVFGPSTGLETHRQVEIRTVHDDFGCAVDGHFMLIGAADSIRAGIDAHSDDTGVDTNARFKSARERLDGDQLGVVFLDGKALVAVLQKLGPAEGLNATLASSAPDWTVAGLHVVDNAIQLDIQAAPVADRKLTGSAPTDPPPSRSQFSSILPAETFAFVEVHGVGANLQRGLAILKSDGTQADAVAQIEQALTAVGGIDNVAGWIEDLGVAAIPSGTSAGGVILLRGSDADAVSSRLTQLRNLLVLASTGTDITVKDSEHAGVAITRVDLGDLGSLMSGLGIDSGITGTGTRLVFSMAAKGDVLILTIGDGAIESVLDTTSESSLATNTAYRQSINLTESPNDAEVYVTISGLMGLVEANIPSDVDLGPWTTDYKPYAEHIEGFGATFITTDKGARSRLVITVK